MKLYLKLTRDIKQSIGQFIALVLVVAVGAFFYGGLVTYSSNLNTYTTEYFREHQLSDLNVYYTQISNKELTALSQIEGINKMEGRYTLDATQAFQANTASLKIHSIPVNNEINTPVMIEGTIPSNKNEILLDSHYAKEHLYQVGDQISIQVNEKDYTFIISGLGENVEYAKKNEIQDHNGYGFAYISEEAVPEIRGGLFYNEVLVTVQEGYDIEELGQAIELTSKPLSYVSHVSKERTFNYSQISETIYNNKLMSRVIPLLLFIIEAIILFLTMSRIIDSQRNQVGVMKAVGVNNRNIMIHYMGYPLLVAIIGSILGCLIAKLIFIPFVTTSNARAYSLPDITFSLSLYSVIPPILFSSAFGMLSCYLSGRSILKERAAQAMRPKPPKKMKKLLIERVPGIWSRLPYSYKLILRNILLNKPKAIASSIGVMVSTVLLITAFGTQAALLRVADQVEEVYSYDLRVDYKMGTSADTLSLPTGIKNSYFLSSFPIALIKDDHIENATLNVTDINNTLIHFYDENNNPLSLQNKGVLVPQSYAEQYNIAEGDLIKIQFTAPELNNKTVEMKVLHISAQYSNPTFYSTPAYLESFGIDYNPTSLLVKTNTSTDLLKVRAFFEQEQHIEAITDKEDLKESAQYILKQNNFVFIMFIICAVILSFGAMYTISSINIYERSRELATLKVLGYQKNQINRLIFFENMMLTTCAVMISIPISGYVYTLIIKALSSTHQQIPDQLNIMIILLSVIFSFLLTMLSNLMLRKKVSRIPMIESLKSVE